MRFEALNGFAVLRRLDPEKVTPGGILLPDGSEKKTEAAVVLEPCPEWIEDGMPRKSMLKPLDVVIIDKYSGQEHELDRGRKVILVRERDIKTKLIGFVIPWEFLEDCRRLVDGDTPSTIPLYEPAPKLDPNTMGYVTG
jgi:chaperonin GroES